MDIVEMRRALARLVVAIETYWGVEFRDLSNIGGTWLDVEEIREDEERQLLGEMDECVTENGAVMIYWPGDVPNPNYKRWFVSFEASVPGADEVPVFRDLTESFGFQEILGSHGEIGLVPIPDYRFMRRYARYSDALADTRWHRKANLAKHRAGFRCEECAAPGALEAHHCYYDRQNHPWEYPIYAIRVLCRSCHKKREHAENYLKLQLSTCNLAGLWRTAQELERTRIGGGDLA